MSGTEDYSMAGDYYLAVSMGREDYTPEAPVVGIVGAVVGVLVLLGALLLWRRRTA